MGIISDVLMPNHEIQKMFSKIVKSRKLNQFTTLEIRNILEDEKCFEKCDKIIHSKRNARIRHTVSIRKTMLIRRSMACINSL